VSVAAVTEAECSELAVGMLGIDAAADLLGIEGLAASLRRAASFLCPASPRQIIDAVLDAVEPLVSSGELARGDLADLLDLLVSAGDLIELPRGDAISSRLLYLGPPSYVEKRPGRYLLTGVRPFGAPLIGTDLASAIQYEGHTRTIELDSREAAAELAGLGLHKIRAGQWARQPAEIAASSLVRQIRSRLAAAGPSGEVEGLTVIDPVAKVTYYRGRWRGLEPTDSGVFVAHRPQAYGADLWCLVRVADGRPQTLADLPAENTTEPAHDEAWRAQAAIDAERGTPQVFRVRDAPGSRDGFTVDFFSPLPRWAERRFELAGMAVPRSAAALCSYRVPRSAMPDLRDFLARMLWMRELTTEGNSDG
jgi:hypothetical protein